MGTTAGVLYQATGRTGLLFYWTIYTSIIYISSYVIGLQWGVFGVAASYVTASLLFVFYPNTRLSGSLIGMSFTEFVKNVSGIFGCAALMSATVYAAGLGLQGIVHVRVGLLLLVALGIAIYVSLLIGLRIQAFEEMKELIIERRRKKIIVETAGTP